MNISEFQAGAYEQQYEYRSFLPTAINHEWNVSDPQIATLLEDANRLLGELNAFSQLIPDVDFFIRMHITKEATTSSRIEGTKTSIEEALAKKGDLDPEKRNDWQEVHNYIQAINTAVKQLRHLPLSNRLLRETHAVLLQGVRGTHKQPGEFRTSQTGSASASSMPRLFLRITSRCRPSWAILRSSSTMTRPTSRTSSKSR